MLILKAAALAIVVCVLVLCLKKDQHADDNGKGGRF